jgi:hypothetical protein
VWHVDKYKITFTLVINHWSNEISYHFVVSQANIIKLIYADFHWHIPFRSPKIYNTTQCKIYLSRPGIIDARARRLRNTGLRHPSLLLIFSDLTLYIYIYIYIYIYSLLSMPATLTAHLDIIFYNRVVQSVARGQHNAILPAETIEKSKRLLTSHWQSRDRTPKRFGNDIWCTKDTKVKLQLHFPRTQVNFAEVSHTT